MEIVSAVETVGIGVGLITPVNVPGTYTVIYCTGTSITTPNSHLNLVILRNGREFMPSTQFRVTRSTTL